MFFPARKVEGERLLKENAGLDNSCGDSRAYSKGFKKLLYCTLGVSLLFFTLKPFSLLRPSRCNGPELYHVYFELLVWYGLGLCMDSACFGPEI